MLKLNTLLSANEASLLMSVRNRKLQNGESYDNYPSEMVLIDDTNINRGNYNRHSGKIDDILYTIANAKVDKMSIKINVTKKVQTDESGKQTGNYRRSLTCNNKDKQHLKISKIGEVYF